MLKGIIIFLIAFYVGMGLPQVEAQKLHKLTVLANKPGPEIQHSMWGIFFEDINFAADGGIYAELVKNRSFEFYEPLMGWKKIKEGEGKGKVFILNKNQKDTANLHYVTLSSESSNGAFGLFNEGFRGMGIREGALYDLTFYARKVDKSNVKLRFELSDPDGKTFASVKAEGFSKDWVKYSLVLKSSATHSHACLKVLVDGIGKIDLDFISLFPRDTWKNRKNGLRADLVQKLADLKPGFIRFPGGCVVEGYTLDKRYQWKNTIGKPEDRKLNFNRWNTELKYRLTPDYFQSLGLGFFEYFQLAEDIGAEPLPILNCGMACEFNSGEIAPMDQLDPFIQDVLDLIEFANGPVISKWGRIRAEMGHPASFNLKMVGIGNEQWGEQYFERYWKFEKVLKEKCPQIKLVSGAGPDPEGEEFNYAWRQLKNSKADLVDEHYYRSPDWFLKNASRYDNYDRKGPKVFAGEYASHTKGDSNPISRNNWESALSEAAFMTGLERNADVVQMASYAPLFAHVNAWQWNPDLIWFDNLNSVATPNYFVQKLYSTNNGSNVIQILENGAVIAGKDSLYASASVDKKSGEIILKLVNVAKAPVKLSLELKGAVVQKTARMQILSASGLSQYNSLDAPENIAPIEKKLKVSGKTIQLNLEGQTFVVLRVPLRK
ncbi:MAG: alpha-L-arabinofuranosidase C-terminal domain-containing protein [Bacteroidota bacterium]|nr:alpha-L-arabinofuranosidase C-terminal domain-containing protein [Bacteroidota bacterium]